MAARLLPQRLTSVERLHVLDDHPAWPNWIGSVLHFSGELDEAAAREALEFALRRHLRGRCGADTSRGRWQWIERDEPSRQFHFARGGRFADWQRPPLPDVRTGPAAIFYGWTSGTASRVDLFVHHALADGLGGLQFVRDWMGAFDNLARGRAAGEGLKPLDPRLLRHRNRLGLLRWSWLRHLWKQPIALYGAGKFLLRRFAVLGERDCGQRDPQRPVDSATWPILLTADVDRDTLHAVRAAARRWDVSLNEWLLAALFEAIVAFRGGQAGDAADWIRIIVPMSLRERADSAMPAAHKTTLVQLDRRAADLQPRIRLAQGIRFELGVIRGWQLDRFFLLAVRWFACLPGGLARQVRWNKPRATTLMTNLGKPLLGTGLESDGEGLSVGGMRLEAMDLVAPVKFGLPIAFAVHQFGHRLRISAQVDTAALAVTSARQLLDLWIDRIVATGEG